MDLVRELAGRLTWRLGLLWLALVGGLWLFVGFADEVLEGGAFPFDGAVLDWFYRIRAPWLDDAMVAVSVAGDVPVTLTLAALIVLLLAWRLRRELGFFVLSLGGASLIMAVTKVGLGRDRPELFPDATLYATASPSFPSGHATAAAALWLTLWWITRRHLAPRWSRLVAVCGLLWTLTVAASRLYLQVHYPSDVLAGLALGIGWVAGVHAIWHRDRSSRFLLLRLPRELAARVRRDAKRRGVGTDELVAELLARELADAEDAPAERSARE